MLRNLAIQTELGLVDMYSQASVQLMHFHGYVHVSVLACLAPLGLVSTISFPPSHLAFGHALICIVRACLGFSVFLDPGHGPFVGTFPFVRRGLLAGNFVWLSRFESARSSPCVLFCLFVGVYFSVPAYFFFWYFLLLA